MNTSSLFSPLRLGSLELKHRVVMPPLTRMRASTPANTARTLTAERSRGGSRSLRLSMPRVGQFFFSSGTSAVFLTPAFSQMAVSLLLRRPWWPLATISLPPGRKSLFRRPARLKSTRSVTSSTPIAMPPETPLPRASMATSYTLRMVISSSNSPIADQPARRHLWRLDIQSDAPPPADHCSPNRDGGLCPGRRASVSVWNDE